PPAATAESESGSGSAGKGKDADWQDLVRDFAREMFGIFKRHPGVAALTMGRVPFGPSMLAGGEYILSQLRAAGLPDQVAAFVGDLGGLYVGAVALEQEV